MLGQSLGYLTKFERSGLLGTVPNSLALSAASTRCERMLLQTMQVDAAVCRDIKLSWMRWPCGLSREDRVTVAHCGQSDVSIAPAMAPGVPTAAESVKSATHRPRKSYGGSAPLVGPLAVVKWMKVKFKVEAEHPYCKLPKVSTEHRYSAISMKRTRCKTQDSIEVVSSITNVQPCVSSS